MRIASKIVALGLAALVLACGRERYANPTTWGPRLEQKDAPEGGEKAAPAKGEKPGAVTPAPSAAGPLETFLQDGLVLPTRLKADVLTVSFRANVQGALFECALGATTPFTACDGSSYAFGKLNHGQSYMLRVRAVTSDGRVDVTPLVVSFVADLLTGEAPATAPSAFAVDAKIPESAQDLPQVVKAGESTATEGRALQVGSYFAVVAPADHQVTSYASNKNYATTQRYFRILPNPRPCTGTFEQEVPGPVGSGASYCEATPNDAEWLQTYVSGGQPVARNHVEMVRASAQGLEEKLLVAAFDEDLDPAEALLGLGTSCQGANYQGQTRVGLLTTFFGEVSPELFHWCQARDEKGEWWWVGHFVATVAPNPTPARLTVVYAVNVRQGLFSGSQFATYAERRLPRLIIPIALPSGTL